MKRTLVFVIVFVTQIAVAQRFNTLNDDSYFIDSLSVLIKSTKSDSLRAINCFKLAELYQRNKNISKFNHFLKIGKQNTKNYPYLQDCLHYYHSLTYLISGDIDNFSKNMVIASKKLAKYKNQDSYILRAAIARNLSTINQVKQNDNEAIRFLTVEALSFAKKAKDYELIGNIYEHIGIIFMNNSDRKKAQEYFTLSISSLARADKLSYSLLENKVECYIIAAENLIYLNRFSEAESLLDKALNILIKHPRNNMYPIYYFSKGLYYFKIKDYKKALFNYDKGIEQSVLHDDRLSLNRLKFSQVRTYISTENYEYAKDVMLDLLEKGNLFTLDKRKIFKELSFTYEKLNDYQKAHYFSKKYIVLSDSLSESRTRELIAELEARFNKSENENRIRQLNAQNEKSLLMVQNTRLKYLVFISISVVLLILLILIFFYSKNKTRLALKKELISKQKIKTLEKQKEIEVMRAMIHGEELERKRLARELHDGIGSKLSALKIALDRLSYKEVENQKFLNINSLLSTSITDLRHISYNLLPESLLKLGLDNALSDLCHLLHSDDVRIEYQSFGIEEDVIISKQLNIYRIVQELINNALKHSKCTEILVACSQNNTLFFISVEDNGIGFPLDKLNENKGLGLKNLKSRVKLLNGNLNIESGQNGTVCNIELKL